MNAANNFIANNIDDLLANNNMPKSFPKSFQKECDQCLADSVTFFAADLTKKEATKKKTEAYVSVYGDTITMLKNAQIIFKDNKAVKLKFSFASLKSSHGTASASLYGTILNDNNMPVEGVLITAMDGKYSANSSNKGAYRINRIEEGTYVFSFSSPGYTPVNQTIVIKAQTKSKADMKLAFSLKKVA